MAVRLRDQKKLMTGPRAIQNLGVDKRHLPVLIIKLVVAKKGVVHHTGLIIIAVIAVWALVLYFLISKNILKIKTPFSPKQPTVELKTEYKNPFNKETQFVNPFDQTKNPFAVAE